MEVTDWTPGGKESFTTPGGPFRRPTGGSDKTYAFSRFPEGTREKAPETPAQPAQVSPFAREAENAPWYSQVQPQPQARPQTAPEGTAPQSIVVSHDGESRPTTVQSSGGGPVYTIQIPSAPRQPAPRRQSLWWLPLLLLLALGLGLLLGVLCYPLLEKPAESGPVTPSSVPVNGETAANRIYREYAASVVGITAIPPNPTGSYVQATAGTGFLISRDGYILTNAHVVANAGQITAELQDGSVLPARLVSLDNTTSDLALLKVEASEAPAVQLGDSDQVQVGDWVCTIGNPLGELSASLSTGYISAGPRVISAGGVDLTMLQINTAVNKGNSGGPLFDEAGRVIGVVTAKLSASETDSAVEGLGFALPINAVLELAEAWMEEDRAA